MSWLEIIAIMIACLIASFIIIQVIHHRKNPRLGNIELLNYAGNVVKQFQRVIGPCGTVWTGLSIDHIRELENTPLHGKVATRLEDLSTVRPLLITINRNIAKLLKPCTDDAKKRCKDVNINLEVDLTVYVLGDMNPAIDNKVDLLIHVSVPGQVSTASMWINGDMIDEFHTRLVNEIEDCCEEVESIIKPDFVLKKSYNDPNIAWSFDVNVTNGIQHVVAHKFNYIPKDGGVQYQISKLYRELLDKFEMTSGEFSHALYVACSDFIQSDIQLIINGADGKFSHDYVNLHVTLTKKPLSDTCFGTELITKLKVGSNQFVEFSTHIGSGPDKYRKAIDSLKAAYLVKISKSLINEDELDYVMAECLSQLDKCDVNFVDNSEIKYGETELKYTVCEILRNN